MGHIHGCHQIELNYASVSVGDTWAQRALLLGPCIPCVDERSEVIERLDDAW